MAPLNALEFSADEGIRNGRQKGSRSDVRNVAYTGRVEYVGVPGLTLGASAWSGKSSFLAPRLDVQVRVGEADVRYKRNRLELRGEFAQVSIDDAERLNLTVGQLTGVSPNIARDTARLLRRGRLSGVAARVRARSRGASRGRELRHQFRMPSGYIPAEAVRS